MRNLLIIIKLLIVVMIIGQPVSTGKGKETIIDNTIKNVKTEIQIKEIIRENETKIAEVEDIRSENKLAIDKMNQLDKERSKLIKSNRKIVDQIVKLSKKIWVRPDIKNTKTPIRVSNTVVKIDSICIKYGRDNIFDKKKCEKWEYYKYTEDSNNNRIVLE